MWHAKSPHVNVEYTWNHPPLALWLIAAGVRLLGNGAWGWRLPSALFGSVGVALAYLLGLRLSGSRFVGARAALLLPLS